MEGTLHSAWKPKILWRIDLFTRPCPAFTQWLLTSLSHTSLSTLLGEKKDDLLPWHSRGCFPHTQKYFHECIMICTHTVCSIYKHVEHQANFQFLASRGTFWGCVGESHGIFFSNLFLMTYFGGHRKASQFGKNQETFTIYTNTPRLLLIRSNFRRQITIL